MILRKIMSEHTKGQKDNRHAVIATSSAGKAYEPLPFQLGDQWREARQNCGLWHGC